MNRKHFVTLVGKSIIGGAALWSGCSGLLLSGCSGLLDQPNPNSLTPDNFWKTANDAEVNLNAIYQNFLWTGSGQFAPGFDRFIPALYRGDDVGITHDVPSWWQIATFTLTAGNDRLTAFWQHYYTGIFRANQVILNVPGISMDSSLKKRYIGEAKFFRGLFYFDLLISYHNIPLILKSPTDSEHYSVSQSSPDDVWGQIEEDLKYAINSLPASYSASDLGRVTKGAAMGYLGKAYLYQQKWSDAIPVFEQIINSDIYSLLTNFEDVFSEDNEFNEESLLEVNYSVTQFDGQDISSYRNKEEGLSEGGGWYEYYPNQWLQDEMSKEKTINGELDPRLYHTILWNGSGMKYYGQSYEALVGAGSTKKGWMKYSGAELDHAITYTSGQNVRILRYADILLMHAEAIVQSGGSLTGAEVSINKVRNRADLKNLSPGMTKNEVLKEIEHQRICELADEANRWNDLLRWNGSIDGSMTIKENLTRHGAIGAANFDPDKHKYLPIPLSEINTNTKIKQNPGY